MSYLPTIPVFTKTKDRFKYPNSILNLFKQRPSNHEFFFSPYEASHPFNLVQPNFSNQPILNLLFELYFESWIRLKDGQYHIRDIDAFKGVCRKYNIRYRYPPQPIFTSPTSDPLHYEIVAEYYKIFASAHRQDNESETIPTPDIHPTDQLIAHPLGQNLLNVHFQDSDSEHYGPPTTTATLPRTRGLLHHPGSTIFADQIDSDDSSSTSSEDTEKPPAATLPSGKPLPTSATRIESHNHALAYRNFQNAKRKRADPTYEYTPEIPIPTTQPSKPKKRKDNSASQQI
jgi:hypothetical protein